MLLGAEIGMFAAGLIMLVKGNLPSMENDPNYSYDTSTFRLLSIIPMIPLPFAIIAGIVLGLTAPEALRHMAKLEWGMLILALIVYSVGYVLLRQPRGSTGE